MVIYRLSENPDILILYSDAGEIFVTHDPKDEHGFKAALAGKAEIEPRPKPNPNAPGLLLHQGHINKCIENEEEFRSAVMVYASTYAKYVEELYPDLVVAKTPKL